MRTLSCRLLAVIVPLALAAGACSEDADPASLDAGSGGDGGVDLGADLGADAALDGGADADATPTPPAPSGVRAHFDLPAAQAGDDAFFDFPWPSDLRVDSDGTIAAEGLPDASRQPLYLDLRTIAGELTGASQVPVVWIRFDAPIAAVANDTLIAADPGSDAFLVNLEADGPGYLELLPLTARNLEADAYTAENVLALAPRRGFVLRPGTTYGLVVRRAWGDADGAPLGVPDDLWALAHGDTPASPWGEDAAAAYAPLWPALDELGVPREEVAAATVFTTGQVVRDLFELSEAVRDAYDAVLSELAVDAVDGADHARYCELHGELTVPQFQVGTPPFDSEGLFDIGDDGLPVWQRDETIPVVVTLPNGTMPEAGFPLALYFHGSGGESAQVVDRGTRYANGTEDPPGFGPAHVLAEHGIGSAGSAHPVNPERVPGASAIAYLNFNNLAVFRDIFRQGVIEQRLYLDSLLELRVDPELVADCDGLALPEGASAYFFDPDSVVAMGQSMGGMYTNLVGPVEPRIRAVVPTGAGGHWSAFIVETELIPNVATLIGTIFRANAELSFMHPLLHTLQLAWEPVEPLVFVPRLARSPLPGHPVRPIYQPVGLGDSYFPPTIFDSFALAYGNQLAGPVVWESMVEALTLDGRAERETFPVVGNRASEVGSTYTGVVVQYAGDGFSDPHIIFAQLDEVKRQYGCFFASFLASGIAVLPEPSGLGGACPVVEAR